MIEIVYVKHPTHFNPEVTFKKQQVFIFHNNKNNQECSQYYNPILFVFFFLVLPICSYSMLMFSISNETSLNLELDWFIRYG